MQDKNFTQSQNETNAGNGNGPKPDKDDKKISLNIIVSGSSTLIEANPKQKLQVIAQKALEQTANTSRPLADWTIKTRQGIVLEMSETVEHYGLADGTELFMSLEAGVGG